MKFASAAELEQWFAAHHDREDELWIELANKGAGVPSVTYVEAVEVALCHGWIDGLVKRSDEPGFRRQRFTPRRAKSKWSQINRERAEALIASGRMQPAGMEQVERARADGRWDAAYPAPSKITVPDDLRAALDAHPAAAERFASLDAQNRYAILYRLHDVKPGERRTQRIAQYVEMLARGETLH